MHILSKSLNTFNQNASNAFTQYMHVRELHVLIYKDNLSTNVAINEPTVASSTYDSRHHSGYSNK